MLRNSTQPCLPHGPEVTPERQVPPGFRGRFICIGVHESRTKNFIRELTRRSFSAIEFQPDRSDLIAYRRSLRESDFVLFGSPALAHLPKILLAKLLGCPVLIDYPMDLLEWPFGGSWRSRWILKRTLRLADYVITIQSRSYMIQKIGLKPERVLFIESCPDLSDLESSRQSSPRFEPRPGSFLICCSGCHDHHRLERFMPTFEALTSLVPGVELILIGDPSKSTVVECKKYAEGRLLNTKMHCLPVIKPPEDFYATLAKCDMWVAALGDDTVQGRHEFRMELLEAGALRLPVVASRLPGLLAHNLADGDDLIFVDPADPQGSAEKLARFIQMPALLAAIGRRLRDRVHEHFSLENAMDHLLLSVAKRPGIAARRQA